MGRRAWLRRRRPIGNNDRLGVDFVIHYLSQIMSLQPGDLIATGTPPGVGMGLDPQTYLKAGQRVQLGVEGLGDQDAVTVDAT